MKKLSVLLVIVLMTACNAVSSLIHDDDVVARVGDRKLYLSELRQYIPSGTAPADSANLALQYINSWATDILYLNVADRQLTKAEKDVTVELEKYRQSLLKYRYEQRYVNSRLDTLITDDQVEEWYKAHEDLFKLERPLLKVRFLDIMKDSQNRETIVKKMSSSSYDDLMVADSLAYSSAFRYFDNSDSWMDAAALAREFGTDYRTMMACLKDSFIQMESDGRLRAAYVVDIFRSGTAPLDYCRENIRDIILSSRKRELLSSLEQDLLEDALGRKQFVIY